ncbi:MAG: DUF4198 domain-containing protein [Campylobacteraceae bacterium]|nr:DUF4198 domain-containing protein [Campylobacteraceae bacterium]
MKKVLLFLLLCSFLSGEELIYFLKSGKGYEAVGLTSEAKISQINPNLEVINLELSGNKLTPIKSGFSYYHLLELKLKDSVAKHYFKTRGGELAKTQVLEYKNSSLDIIPVRLPSQKGNFTSSRSYKFKLLFRGKPLPYHRVTLRTLNGSEVKLLSDEKGVFKLKLPDDLSCRESSTFILSSSFVANNKEYKVSLSEEYIANSLRCSRSQTLGVLAIVLGMAGGVVLYRRVKNVKS